jgi:tRNA pseudouridine55 synthase
MNNIDNKTDFEAGQVILINKPFEWTSFDVVKKLRSIICRSKGIKKLKVGHAGTLDPLATGLMIICTGKATKQISGFFELDKEYIAEFKIGETTPSFDLETEIDKTYEIAHINEDYINKSLEQFKGYIDQVPPDFSATWINGKRAYDLARNGKKIDLKPKKIFIKEINLLFYEPPVLGLKINCSKGTYIRSLARDLGYNMKSGAHLTKLCRTRIGEFHLNNAYSIDNFQEKIK